MLFLDRYLVLAFVRLLRLFHWSCNPIYCTNCCEPSSPYIDSHWKSMAHRMLKNFPWLINDFSHWCEWYIWVGSYVSHELYADTQTWTYMKPWHLVLVFSKRWICGKTQAFNTFTFNDEVATVPLDPTPCRLFPGTFFMQRFQASTPIIYLECVSTYSPIAP